MDESTFTHSFMITLSFICLRWLSKILPIKAFRNLYTNITFPEMYIRGRHITILRRNACSTWLLSTGFCKFLNFLALSVCKHPISKLSMIYWRSWLITRTARFSVCFCYNTMSPGTPSTHSIPTHLHFSYCSTAFTGIPVGLWYLTHKSQLWYYNTTSPQSLHYSNKKLLLVDDELNVSTHDSCTNKLHFPITIILNPLQITWNVNPYLLQTWHVKESTSLQCLLLFALPFFVGFFAV